MSYKALLFCPDEAAARLVTQVLSELEFTVELSFEPYITVKKLSEEPFDALVVDCNDEQNASVLFKGARNSTLNHSSLCVAVAEGQTGVAKAFKIGANLVLTKPINIEQSKNTLRVAKGLLRKNAPGPRPTAEGHAQAHVDTHAPVSPGFPAATVPSALSNPGVANTPQPAPLARGAMPSSLLEAEQAKAPVTEPAQPIRPAAVTSLNIAGPVTGRSAGAAAAPAMAREKSDHSVASVTEMKSPPEVRTAPPLATQDPIFPETTFRHETELNIPSILSHARQPMPKSGGGSKVIWIVACLLIVGAAGYFGWRKFQPMRYIHFGAAPAAPPASAPVQTAETRPSPDSSVTSSEVPAANLPPASAEANVPSNSSATVPATTSVAAEGFPTKERIDISPPAEEPEPTVTVAPKPLQVSKKAVRPSSSQSEAPAPAPPPVVLGDASTSNSALAGIVATNVTLPKPTPGTLRISQGITQGLLVKRVPPSYPMSALQMRKEGVVELLATISKTGAISQIKVLSGESTLAKSAVDAVRQWKYRPYLLNGEPVEIETQITINFKLPH